MQTYQSTAAPLPATACPHLGLREDAATRCVFASQSHRCHRDGKPRLVPLDQQVSLCLSSQYDQCPVFGGARLLTPGARRWWPLRALAIAGGAAGVAIAVAIGVRLQLKPVMTSAPEPARAATAASTMAATTPIMAATPMPVAVEPAVVATRSPVRYRVRAGDNLTEVAAFFGARVEDVIRVNGLPASGAIVAGQELIIPQAP